MRRVVICHSVKIQMADDFDLSRPSYFLFGACESVIGPRSRPEPSVITTLGVEFVGQQTRDCGSRFRFRPASGITPRVPFSRQAICWGHSQALTHHFASRHVPSSEIALMRSLARCNEDRESPRFMPVSITSAARRGFAR